MTMPFDADSELTDEALLALYASGNRGAARTLTLRLTPRVLSLSARMLGDRSEAEDVAQEAMLRLWKIAPEWRTGEAQVSTWLYRVASNLCTDRLRRRRGVGLDDAFGEGVEPTDEQPRVEERMQTTQRATALREALAELPERQRQAVVLRHLEGLSNPEIAAVMEIGVEAVESLTARGKRALSALLKGRRAELGLSDDG
ncbi:RNA polymerase sigma factor [Aliiruegeria sabulilitoris]|uniref:RNA polymerase sigma factor n=1 Tax=Aliiruegeria sabulilitoris TaxID=1510458 RepID=UPI00083251DB|nr:RNA polymerase sigma factor [Aliiruegeria sabulilitoris]NDR59230.1 RNA polymerase sigma factor [Pseudoruegeria sp. M32A2M]